MEGSIGNTGRPRVGPFHGGSSTRARARTRPFPSLTDTPPKLKGTKYVTVVQDAKKKLLAQSTEAEAYYVLPFSHFTLGSPGRSPGVPPHIQ